MAGRGEIFTSQASDERHDQIEDSLNLSWSWLWQPAKRSKQYATFARSAYYILLYTCLIMIIYIIRFGKTDTLCFQNFAPQRWMSAAVDLPTGFWWSCYIPFSVDENCVVVPTHLTKIARFNFFKSSHIFESRNHELHIFLWLHDNILYIYICMRLGYTQDKHQKLIGWFKPLEQEVNFIIIRKRLEHEHV